MAGPDIKVDKGKGNPESKNLHLSDDRCILCNGNLPEAKDMHIFLERHKNCINVLLRGALVAKKK